MFMSQLVSRTECKRSCVATNFSLASQLFRSGLARRRFTLVATAQPSQKDLNLVYKQFITSMFPLHLCWANTQISRQERFICNISCRRIHLRMRRLCHQAVPKGVIRSFLVRPIAEGWREEKAAVLGGIEQSRDKRKHVQYCSCTCDMTCHAWRRLVDYLIN